MPSFDIVSEVNEHELTNAVDQASREIANRFDFKGSNATFSLKDNAITMAAPSDFQLKQMLDILYNKMAKRGCDIRSLELKTPEVSLHEAKQIINVKQGIDPESAKKITKLIKDSKLKVQASIQGEKIRVTGKSRDDLQSAIASLKEAKLELPLQYDNFRD